jgi:hypothetical protein
MGGELEIDPRQGLHRGAGSVARERVGGLQPHRHPPVAEVGLRHRHRVGGEVEDRRRQGGVGAALDEGWLCLGEVTAGSAQE